MANGSAPPKADALRDWTSHRVIPLGISIALVIHSLNLTPECIDEGRPFLLTLGIPIALTIHSLDLRWSGESRPGEDLYRARYPLA